MCFQFGFDAPAFHGKLYPHPSVKGGQQSMATLKDEGRLAHSYLSVSGAHVFISTSLPLTLPLLSLRHPPALVLSPLPPLIRLPRLSRSASSLSLHSSSSHLCFDAAARGYLGPSTKGKR